MTLQWMLAQDKRGASLKALARECKIRRDKGAWTSSMVSTLVRRGYKPFVAQDVTWDQVEELLQTCHILVSWWTMFFPSGEDEGGGAHWSAIAGLTNMRVALYDPTFECVVQYPRGTLDALWLSPEYNGEAGVLNDECRLAIFVPRRPLKSRKKR